MFYEKPVNTDKSYFSFHEKMIQKLLLFYNYYRKYGLHNIYYDISSISCFIRKLFKNLLDN